MREALNHTTSAIGIGRISAISSTFTKAPFPLGTQHAAAAIELFSFPEPRL